MVVDWGMTDKRVIKEKSNDSRHKTLVRRVTKEMNYWKREWLINER